MNWELEAVDKLEEQETYGEALGKLYALWQGNPADEKLLIRLGFLAWYVIVEWPLIPHKDLAYKDFEGVLHEVTTYGLKHMSDSKAFNWVMGYMISLFPYHFGDYEEKEKQGVAMLEKAHHMDEDDPIIKMLYLGHQHKSHPEAYREACQRSKVLISERFKGCGALASYFREVLDR